MTKEQLREAFIARQRAFLATDPKEDDDKILKAVIAFYDFGVEDTEKRIQDVMDETLLKMRQAVNAKDELGTTIFSSQYEILEELLEMKGE